MTGRIRRCPYDRTYTLSSLCPLCGQPTRTAHPARFSPEDRYGSYRRAARLWMK
ncbi:MAG: RNA-protein complex protein Nop10 [Methanoregulaceae archaeon]|nr:RNA-protein complex protein Nop10 [Methanoregulaceae archaeon]